MTEIPAHLELRLLEPAVRASVVELERLLADDFIEFGSSGTVYDKATTIKALCSLPSADTGHRQITDMQSIELGPNIVLLRYRSVLADGGNKVVREALRSSIWRMVDGRWQMVFHQGTIIP